MSAQQLAAPLEAPARFGFLGYGLVHLLFAWLILQLALGRPGDAGDQSGALRTLAQQPLGGVLIGAVAIGLLAMAVWQVLEAAAGHREDRGTERTLERLASAGRVAVYAYFAWTAYQVLSGANSDSAGKQQSLSTDLMAASGGRWLVALGGVALAALGAGLIWYGLAKRFEKHLRTGQMSLATRRLARRLGAVGYLSKGIAYGIAGVLFVVAAATYDPDKARGLDATLDTLRRQTYGTLLLILMALGIGAFAAFCVVQARYRKV